MSAGWGLNKKRKKSPYFAKESEKVVSNKTASTSPKSRKLRNHKSYRQMETYKSQLQGKNSK